ncbi:MAG: DegT/DnrJ/EryC1/StrS family aminotransferase, partial [Thiomargarita sp.]|nr:DegT/DnrJ/EryC1/StrS family aminotransferase [Thiomargarita sp.]
KTITTGEGGMVTTNHPELAERLHQMRNHGASISEEQRHQGPKPIFYPEFNLLGYNYRMTDLQGAVGSKQLEKLDQFINERRQWAEFYIQELGNITWLRMPQHPKKYYHGWQSFVTFVEQHAPLSRNKIMEYLQQKGISTRAGTHAMHMLGYYQERFGFKTDDYPGARDCDRHSMAIPLHNRMTAEDYEYVVKTIKTLNKK